VSPLPELQKASIAKRHMSLQYLGSPSGTIQISAMTHELFQDNYIFSKNGLVQGKGLGEIEAYALVGKR